jgi:hypothetical protein
MAISKTPAAAAGARGKGVPKPRAGRRRSVAACVAIVVAIAAGYVALLLYYQGEADSRSSEILVGDSNATDRIDVGARLLSVDQQQEQAVIRLSFEPKGAIAADGGATAVPLKVFVNSSNGSQERVFDKGKVMSRADVTLDLYDGTITDYPLDRFTTELRVGASTSTPTSAEAQPIPVAVDFIGSLHGLKVDEAALVSDQVGGVVPVNIAISRSPTTIAVAFFIISLLMAMALSVLGLTLSILLWGRKLEPPIIGLLGALMFGFVAFRNALPGTPPVGALSDYLSFFWAEGIVAVCLFVLVAVYFRRSFKAAPA